MHRDHKLALALALLLIGIAAALCFPRQQPDELADLELEDTDQLDTAINRLPVRVYTEPHNPTADPGAPDDGPEPAELKPGLRDPFVEFALLPDAPDPIPLADVTPPPVDRVRERETPAAASIRVEAWPQSEPRQSAAASPVDAPNHPELYEVQPGDTLSGLAARFLGSTRRFVELYEANRDVLASPDDLQVGMRLRIPRRGTRGELKPDA